MLYVIATVAFLIVLFLFVQSQGVSWRNLWIAITMFLPAIAATGYLFVADLIEGKQRQDARLEHLTREVLHEINLPISTIEANIRMLERSLDGERDLRRIERIRASLVRLRRLYDELSYNIKREFHAVKPESFDLAEAVRERVAVHREMERNPFELRLEPLGVLVDRIGLEQVLDNLIENAMKYSKADRPIVLVLEGAVLTICDDGVGMDATEIARIYERYYQGDSHSPGEGIGLALVKRYCDESGIGIRIESKPKTGTMVRLDFAQVIQK
jgi:signal transduction histidine kinase